MENQIGDNKLYYEKREISSEFNTFYIEMKGNNVEIIGDGTSNGTKVIINGEQVKGIQSLDIFLNINKPTIVDISLIVIPK